MQCFSIVGLSIAALAVVAASRPESAIAADAPAPPPNIIVIVADDLGYGEVFCQGEQEIPTPRIASLARNGVCLSNAYVTCPVCSPTRAGLLTGRYQQRFGHEFNPGPVANAADNFGLPLGEVTLARRLKQAGYVTGMVGKWHLGYTPAHRPLRRGFDEFFGFLGGAHSYVNSAADPRNAIYRGNDPVQEASYLTDAFGREAVAFIDRHKQQPFFLYLTFNAVHNPLQAPEKYRSHFATIQDEKRRTFAAMLSALDDNVGAVLDKLAHEQLDGQTLIFFISDNGGPTPQTTSSNGPLRGFKAQTWEGGIRVPAIVQWKGTLPADKVYDLPVSSLDILPTAVAAAGGSLSGGAELDGVNLVPYLTGKKPGRPHEMLYWRFGPQWAIRKGDFKLVQPPAPAAVQLFNLADDIGEKHDLAVDKPRLAKELMSDYEAWNSQLVEPRWRPQRPAGVNANGQPRANARRNLRAKAGKAGI